MTAKQTITYIHRCAAESMLRRTMPPNQPQKQTTPTSSRTRSLNRGERRPGQRVRRKEYERA